MSCSTHLPRETLALVLGRVKMCEMITMAIRGYVPTETRAWHTMLTPEDRADLASADASDETALQVADMLAACEPLAGHQTGVHINETYAHARDPTRRLLHVRYVFAGHDGRMPSRSSLLLEYVLGGECPAGPDAVPHVMLLTELLILPQTQPLLRSVSPSLEIFHFAEFQRNLFAHTAQPRVRHVDDPDEIAAILKSLRLQRVREGVSRLDTDAETRARMRMWQSRDPLARRMGLKRGDIVRVDSHSWSDPSGAALVVEYVCVGK